MIDARLEQLFAHLHRGGAWAYYWTLPDKRSCWHPTGHPTGHNGAIPTAPHLYFGVHPTHAKRNTNQRARSIDISAVNCLFAEFDAKDFDNLKESTLTHIHNLALPPSVVVDSGGGYHCYWLLHEPFTITNQDDRARINRIQKTWVAFVGSDDGAKDLARVLRVPGTQNAKYTPPRPVTFVSANFAELYELDDLEAISYTPSTPEPATGPMSTADNAYAKAALDGELARVRSAHPSTRNTTLNKAAFVLGQLVGAGVLDRASVEPELLHAALTTGLPRQEALRTLQSGLDAGAAQPRQLPAQVQAVTGSPAHADLNRALGDPQASSEKSKSPPPTDDELAGEWKQQHPHTAYGLGEFRRYDHGIWVFMPEETIEAELLAVIMAAKGRGVRPSARLLASVKKLASVIVSVCGDRWNADPDIIVCRNGTLHVPTMALREHRAEDYQTSGLSFNYDPRATAPVWNDTLQSTVPWAADFLQEFAGYSLTTDTRYELAIWLCGPRGSGKSTILTGLQAMLGERAGVLGLADIERSSFALASLPGKTLVVSTEQPAQYMQCSHVLNAIISGELVHVDRKFRDPVDIRPRAKIAWAMNDMPRVPDAGNGLFRRVKVIKFPKLGEDADPKVKETIETEGAGILNWALAGLVRLRANNRFTIPQCVADATNDFQQTNDVPAVFVSECCTVGPELKVAGGALYEEYKTWCLTNGHKPQSSTSLAREWERLGFDKYQANGRTFYRGIGLAVQRIGDEK
jgi:P4 family phage/plasmid primase-like protien